jgi:putative membrane protein
MYHHYFSYPGANWFGFGISWLFQVAFWLIIIWVVYSLFKKSRHQDDSDSVSQSSALDILKERYAKGELTKKQFEDMKQDITA